MKKNTFKLSVIAIAMLSLTAAFASSCTNATEPTDQNNDTENTELQNKPMPTIPTSPVKAVKGTVYRTQLLNKNFGQKLTVDIYTPEGYSTDKTYPVLYMHDGQNLFDPNTTWNKQSWNVDDAIAKLVAEGKMEAPIVVGIHSLSATRIGDLMPEKMKPYIKDQAVLDYIDDMCGGQYRGDEYVDFMVNTLKPFVDSVFSTKPEPQHTAVMGSSMGGLMSFYALCEAPHVFSKAGCLSTHIGTDPEDGTLAYALMDYLKDNLPKDNTHFIYLDCGDQNVDAPYAPFFPELVQTIKDAGYQDRVLHGFYPGAGHSENDWAARVHIPLEYFFK